MPGYDGDSLTLVVADTCQVNWVAGTGGFWHDPANWSGGILPGTSDHVCINVPGDINVTHSSGDTSVGSLLSTEAVTLSGGSLSVELVAKLDGALTQTGGGLSGPGDYLFNGPLTWTGGTADGPGRSFTNGGVDIGGPGTKAQASRKAVNSSLMT